MRTLAAVSIRAMRADVDDMGTYAREVCRDMSPDDVHDPGEFATMLSTGELLAWFAEAGSRVVGWAALAPWHGGYLPGAWHLYGVWVAGDMRGRGIARELWARRLALVPSGVDVTVSIQPGKVASEALAKAFGFVELGAAPPWINHVRRGRPE